MPILHLEALPPQTTRKTIVRLLVQVGGLTRNQIGTVRLMGRSATVVIPPKGARRLAATIDGASVGPAPIRATIDDSDAAIPGEGDPGTASSEACRHLTTLVDLLRLEAEAETAQLVQRLRTTRSDQAERTGATLLGLSVAAVTEGLGGRTLISLHKRSGPDRVRLPWTRLSVGSPVFLSRDAAEVQTSDRGVISERSEYHLQVALEGEDVELPRGRFRVDLASDEIGRRRQEAALRATLAAEEGRLSELRELLAGRSMPRFTADTSSGRAAQTPVRRLFNAPDDPSDTFDGAGDSPPAVPGGVTDLDETGGPIFDGATGGSDEGRSTPSALFEPASPLSRPASPAATFVGDLYDAEPEPTAASDRIADGGGTAEQPARRSELNVSQKAAIAHALAARDVAIIHGPPGTGKTTTVAELIRQAVARGERVLACAPSNVGVDNLLEKVLAAGVRSIRVGHPARVLPALREATLDIAAERHDQAGTLRRLYREASRLRESASRRSHRRGQGGSAHGLREQARYAVQDAKRLEAWIIRDLLDSADVLCGTLTGLDDTLLSGRTFDLVVIDEACQSTEPACWIPLLRGRRLVLAGDHRQLPPTVLSPVAAEAGFRISLMERLVDRLGDHVTRQLTVQYRMHEDIAAFSSREFYDDTLVSDPSVNRHTLADLPDVDRTDWTAAPLELIDTGGADLTEEKEPDGESKRNVGEARLVADRVQRLLCHGVRPDQIAVIAPYAAQVRHLRRRMAIDDLEIDTVDGFQGREKEAVVISLTRSNPTGEIGFLSDARRMNVALTRARRKLIVIGDSATLGGDAFFARLFAYFQERGAYRSVWEECPGEIATPS